MDKFESTPAPGNEALHSGSVSREGNASAAESSQTTGAGVVLSTKEIEIILAALRQWGNRLEDTVDAFPNENMSCIEREINTIFLLRGKLIGKLQRITKAERNHD